MFHQLLNLERVRKAALVRRECWHWIVTDIPEAQVNNPTFLTTIKTAELFVILEDNRTNRWLFRSCAMVNCFQSLYNWHHDVSRSISSSEKLNASFKRFWKSMMLLQGTAIYWQMGISVLLVYGSRWFEDPFYSTSPIFPYAHRKTPKDKYRHHLVEQFYPIKHELLTMQTFMNKVLFLYLLNVAMIDNNRHTVTLLWL